MGRLRKFWLLTALEKKLLCEAAILLLVSSASVKAIAFRHIYRFLRTHWDDTFQADGDIDQEQAIRLVKDSVSRAANVLPWKNLCLSRSIAQFIMLRRRGIPAVLFLGARFSDQSSLDAHAWVDAGPLAKDEKSSKRSGYARVISIGTGAVNL